MLAKLWKKVLLAICIVACLYNIMNKFVNKSSIEASLKNVKGDSILSVLKQDEEQEQSDTIDGVMPPEATNNIETSNIVTETDNEQNNTQIENTDETNEKNTTIVIY